MSPVRVRDNKRRFYGAQSADERKLRRKTASTGKSGKKDYTKDKSNTGSNKSGGDDKTSSLHDENSYPINSKSSAKKLAELSSDEDLLNESDLEEEFDLLNDNDNGGDVFDPNNCTDGSSNNNKSDDEDEIEEATVAATAVESDDEVVSPVKRLFVSNTKKRRIIEEDHDESEDEEDATVQLEGEESGEDLMVEVVEGVVTETNGGKSGSSKRGEKNRVVSSKKSTRKVAPSKEAKKRRVSESSDGEGEPPIKKVKPKPTTKKEPNSNKSTVKKFNVSSKKTPISTGGGASSKEIKKKLAHLVGKATNKSLYVQKKLAKAAAATLAAAGEEEDSHASDLDDASVDERYAVGGGGAKGGGSNWEDTSSKTKDSRSRKKLVAMSRSSTSSTNKKREKNSFEFDEDTVAQDDEDMHSSDDEKSGDEESEYHPTQADDLIVGVGVVSRPRRFLSRNQQKENVADDVVVMTEMKTSGKRGGGRRTKKKKEEEVVVQSEDEDIDVEPSKQKSTRTSHRVKKTAEKELMSEDEDIEEESVHKQKKKRSTTSRRGKKRAVENELMSEDEASDVERRTFRRVKKTAGKELTSNDEDVVEAPRRKRFIPKGEATKSQSTQTKKQPEQPLLSDSGEPTDNKAVAIKASKKKKLAKNLQLENEESDVEPPKKKSPRDSAVFMKIASKRVSGRQGKKLTDGVLSEVDEHVAVPPSEKAGRCKRTGSSNSKGRGELSDSDGEAGVRTDNGNDEEEDDFWEADGGNDDPFDVFEPEDDISAPKEVVLEKKSGRKRKKNSTSCGRAGLSDIFTQRDPATCSSNSNAEEEEEVEAPANKTKNGDKSKGVEPTGESQSESVKKQEEGNTTSSGNETVDATTFVQFSTRYISEDLEKYRAAVQSQYYQSEGSSSTQSHSNSKAGLSAVISRDEKETRSKHTNDELLGVLVILKEKHEKSREIKKQTNKCAAAWGDSLKQETKLDGEIEVLLAKAHRLAKGRWETTTIM